MFQFTREFIINDSKGKLGANKDQKYVWDASTLYIDNLVNIRKKDVHAWYKNPAKAAAKEVITMTFDAGLAPVRITLNIGLDPERVSAEVNDYYLNHTKEFIFEAATAADFAKQLDKVIAMNENEMFSYTISGSVVTLTARDPFVRFKSVDVQEVNSLPYTAATPNPVYFPKAVRIDINDLTTNNKYTDSNSKNLTIARTQEGSVGVGTTRYIINNLRLPTIENLNPYNGSNTDERPVPGALYDQYTIELVTERRHIGGQVMGALDHSLSTLVFFVLTDNGTACPSSASSDFEAAVQAFLGIAPQAPVVSNSAPGKNLTLHVGDYTDDAKAYTVSDTSVINSGNAVDDSTFTEVSDTTEGSTTTKP